MLPAQGFSVDSQHPRPCLGLKATVANREGNRGPPRRSVAGLQGWDQAGAGRGGHPLCTEAPGACPGSAQGPPCPTSATFPAPRMSLVGV